jgi:hypothetical protein
LAARISGPFQRAQAIRLVEEELTVAGAVAFGTDGVQPLDEMPDRLEQPIAAQRLGDLLIGGAARRFPAMLTASRNYQIDRANLVLNGIARRRGWESVKRPFCQATNHPCRKWAVNGCQPVRKRGHFQL